VSDLSGQLIDNRYELLKIIANGGMGTIYEGIDIRLDRKVAVKIMHPHLAQDEEFISRFIREAKAAASLSHPNIVNVMDQGWNQSGIPAVFLVMELVEGQTLRELISQKEKFSVNETINYLSPVVSALSAAHQIGIVHRDIKPENILISHDGRIKIADFGLARGTNLGQTMTAEASVILGSVSYLSPEQVQRGISDSRSDIYSIGVMAFEMLTGKRPHISDSPLQIAYMHVNEEIPKVSSKNIKLPKELDELIYSATSRNPDDRPKDATAFSNALRNIQIKFDPSKQQMSLELDIPIRKEAPKPKKIVEIEETKEITKPIEKIKKPKKSRKKLALFTLFLAVALGVGGWWTLVGPGAKVTVPSLIGGTIDQADGVLKPLGLTQDVTSQQFSEDIAKGIIISTDPEGGGKIAPGGVVHLTLSKGPERYQIPDLSQLTQSAAIKQLSSLPIAAPVVVEAFSDTIPNGLVISTSPVSGTLVKRGAGIKIIVSKGIEQIPLASFVGKSGEEALNVLVDAGFKVYPTYAFSETMPMGAVVSQDPSEAKDYPKGTKINLVISKGSAYVFIPNIYSLTEAKAKSTLAALDLNVVVKRMGVKAIKHVTAISPKVGTKVLRGSKVTITVG
jgi:eukaryotic-like serine/threonine-protein kinase